MLKNKILEYKNKITSRVLDIDTSTLDIIDKNAIDDGSRDYGGLISDDSTNKLDKLVTIIGPNIDSLINPDLLIKKYEDIKTNNASDFQPKDIAHIDKIIKILKELNKIWIKSVGVTTEEGKKISLALTYSREIMRFQRKFLVLDKDGSHEITLIDGAPSTDGSIFKIDDGFKLNKIGDSDPKPVEKAILKIIYSYIRYELKSDASDLKNITRFIFGALKP
jgi:hypothetical protein